MLFNEKEFLEKCDNTIKYKDYIGWWYKNKPFTEFPEGFIGFIYKITCINKSNEYFGWTYFGMKQFYSTTTKKLGKKALEVRVDKRSSKKVKTTNESNWKIYDSSSIELKALIKKNPTHFKKEIIDLCKTKKQMSFKELELLIKNNVLYDDKNWNKNVLNRYFRKDV